MSLKRIIEAQAISIMGRTLGALKNRIFLQGMDAGGGLIGQYSRKPIYVSVRKEGKTFKTSLGSQVENKSLKPRGKGESGYVYGNFKNGNPRKSSYFASGYYEFRAAVKRKNDKVNLSLTGQLQADIKYIKSGGFLEAAIFGADSIAKARGNELRFNARIFELSASEKKGMEDMVDKAADKAFDELVKRLGMAK